MGTKLLVAVSILLGVLSSAVNAGRGPGGGSGSPGLLTEQERTDLVFMRLEEKLARDSYLVLHDRWRLSVFANIAQSEQSHTDAIESLLEKHGISDPVADESVIGDFENNANDKSDPINQHFQELFDALMEMGEGSELDGLKVGALIEETDMRDIQAAIENTAHSDIERVYENLLCGSRNHLRAFVRNIENAGGTFVALVLAQEDMDAIAYSAMERCGGR